MSLWTHRPKNVPPAQFHGEFGTLSEAQARALTEHVRGRVVHDLGCGSGGLARGLVTLGAHRVVAIDNHTASIAEAQRSNAHPAIEYRVQHVEDCEDAIEVAFVSWPILHYTYAARLTERLASVPLVVYLGRNTGGLGCGSPKLFHQFVRRKRLAMVEDPHNTLLVLGKLGRARRPCGEEWAGICMGVAELSYEDARRESDRFVSWRQARHELNNPAEFVLDLLNRACA